MNKSNQSGKPGFNTQKTMPHDSRGNQDSLFNDGGQYDRSLSNVSHKNSSLQRSVTTESKENNDRALLNSFNSYSRSMSGQQYDQYFQNDPNQSNSSSNQNFIENMPTQPRNIYCGEDKDLIKSAEVSKQNLIEKAYDLNEGNESYERNSILNNETKILQQYSRQTSKSREVTLNDMSMSNYMRSPSFDSSAHIRAREEFLKKLSYNSNDTSQISAQPIDTDRDIKQIISSTEGSNLSDYSRAEQDCREILEQELRKQDQNPPHIADLHLNVAVACARNSKKVPEALNQIEKALAICENHMEKYPEIVPVCQKIGNILTQTGRLRSSASNYLPLILSVLEKKEWPKFEKERVQTIITLSIEDYRESKSIESLRALIQGLKAQKKLLGERTSTYKKNLELAHMMIAEKKVDFVSLNQADEARAFLEESLNYFEKTTNQLELISPLMNLGKFYKDDGQAEKALEKYQAAKKLCDLNADEKHPYLAEISNKITTIQKALLIDNEIAKTKRKIELERHNFSQKVTDK